MFSESMPGSWKDSIRNGISIGYRRTGEESLCDL